MSSGNGSRGRLDSSGDELEGLMQQYENDVDSRLKVDELVRRWSTRNEGANTPESRQQRLSQMRTDFSQIKEESAKTKKTSLFARICNFFGKSVFTKRIHSNVFMNRFWFLVVGRRKGRSVKAVELDDLEARGDITAEGGKSVLLLLCLMYHGLEYFRLHSCHSRSIRNRTVRELYDC